MANALVLAQPVLLDSDSTPTPTSARRRPDPRIASTSRYVYGDSTPFPDAVDFIASIRAVVACGVGLMKSQHAIDCARARVADAQEHLVSLHADLSAMAGSVYEVLAPNAARPTRSREVADRIATMARGVVTTELRHAKAELDACVVRADRTIGEARKTGGEALGALLARHELPGATFGFRLFAEGEGYEAEAVVALPCGVRGTFEARLPEGHAWSTLRRVRDARKGVLVTIPREVGWLRKELQPVTERLDDLFVLGASVDGARGALLLGKSARAGVLHAFDLDLTARRARWRDGDEHEVMDLSGPDAAGLIALLRAIEQSTRDLRNGRGTMTDATVDSAPLGERDPADTCVRLVDLVAPVVREIGRRSGAAGELVLRRNVDSGRRDEVFVTTAELLEQVNTLPPSLRDVFDPLGLRLAPRSPRAPARSLATYEEISACEILPAE